MSEGSPSQSILIEGCRSSNRKIQNLLFDTYQKKVLSICLRYASNLDQAKDIQQEAFIKIFQALANDKIQIDVLGAWIFKLVVNTAIDYLRKERSAINRVGDFPISSEIAPDALSKLDAEDLTRLIQRIPSPFRTVFNLYVVDGLKHKEIAQLLGINESTSRSYLSRAKESIKEKLHINSTEELAHG